jgi:hypothetical protein
LLPGPPPASANAETVLAPMSSAAVAKMAAILRFMAPPPTRRNVPRTRFESKKCNLARR